MFVRVSRGIFERSVIPIIPLPPSFNSVKKSNGFSSITVNKRLSYQNHLKVQNWVTRNLSSKEDIELSCNKMDKSKLEPAELKNSPIIELKTHASRKFYDLSQGAEHKPQSQQQKDQVHHNLFNYIYQNVIGNETVFAAPFGMRNVVYCDYVASGKPLRFLEKFISEECYTMYGNTHTTTSVTSLQSTLTRHEARDIIRNCTNASEHDAVIFAGSGCTGAVHKFISVLGLSKSIPSVVFVGPYEHHSILLPWKEIGARVIRINENEDGLVDLVHLEFELKNHQKKGFKLIGSFSSASNVTGILTDVNTVTALLHRYGALSVWDYACGGPYLDIDMNPVITGPDQELVYKDAVFLSPHKFVGGPDSPGILIAKKKLFVNPVPLGCGGGSVFFVSKETHRYLQEVEMREEGGTPAIIGSIRAGLVFQLKDACTTKAIEAREKELCQLAFDKWSKVPELVLLGNQTVPRLAIFSFLIKHPASGYFLHHNYVCSLLNDIFGIQTRGGCACAGPYAQDLLGIDEQLAQRIEYLLVEDGTIDRVHLRRYREYNHREILRPGFSRLNLPFFMSNEDVDFVLNAVCMIAKHGWKLLPLYILNFETGEWKHKSHQQFRDRKWLGSISYATGEFQFTHPKEYTTGPLPVNRQDCLRKAQELFDSVDKIVPKSSLPDQSLLFDDEAKPYRIFLLPSEAHAHLFPREGNGKLPVVSKLLYEPQSKPFPKLEKTEVVKTTEAEPLICKLPRKTDVSKALLSTACKWHSPPKNIFKPLLKANDEFKMIKTGDRVLVCLSGGKDSLSMLHSLHQLQFYMKKQDINFSIGAVTVDPGSNAYDPRPLIPYLASLGVPYFFESQGIIEQAANLDKCKSICSFCSRMKRGRIYACARREGYNVIALGQHLDDLAESFLMSIFHNGRLRTMKVNYTVKEKDMRVIRPFAFVREKNLRNFAEEKRLPVIPENCPGCFEAPKERHRTKQLLAQQEALFPRLFVSLLSAIKPLMAINRTGIESGPNCWLNAPNSSDNHCSDTDDDDDLQINRN